MLKIRRKFVDIADGQIHLRIAGEVSDKATIMCCHMVPKSGRSFLPLMPEFAKDRLVIAPDYPGYGESSPIPNQRPAEISDYVDAMELVIKHLELEHVMLVGYHTGSMVVTELAYRRPDIVSKVIMLSAPIFTEKEVASFSHYYKPVPLDKEGTRFKLMWERILHFNDSRLPLEKAAESLAENLRGGERYEEGHAAAFEYSREFTNFLQHIQQPVWVMNLKDDLFENTKRVDAYLNNGRTFLIGLTVVWNYFHPKLRKKCLSF